MSQERDNKKIPEWAETERLEDQKWIAENLHIFQHTAQTAFESQGRGVIVVDATTQILGEGNPFGYISQEAVEQTEDADVQRMTKEYDPAKEFVIVIIKPEDRLSTYRVQPTPRTTKKKG